MMTTGNNLMKKIENINKDKPAIHAKNDREEKAMFML